jgi:hypothetical protein
MNLLAETHTHTHTHTREQEMHHSLESARAQARTRLQQGEESVQHAQRMLEQHNARWSRAYAQVSFAYVASGSAP